MNGIRALQMIVGLRFALVWNLSLACLMFSLIGIFGALADYGVPYSIAALAGAAVTAVTFLVIGMIALAVLPRKDESPGLWGTLLAVALCLTGSWVIATATSAML